MWRSQAESYIINEAMSEDSKPKVKPKSVKNLAGKEWKEINYKKTDNRNICQILQYTALVRTIQMADAQQKNLHIKVNHGVIHTVRRELLAPTNYSAVCRWLQRRVKIKIKINK